MQFINDKKTLGVNNLKVQLLKRIGIQQSFKLFLKWMKKKLNLEYLQIFPLQ